MHIEERTIAGKAATLKGDVHSYATAIILLGVTARLGLVWTNVASFPTASLFKKGLELGFMAQSIAAGHGLSSPFGGTTGPSAYLAPGYPALIAAIFTLCGNFTLSSAIVVMVLQTLFSAMTLGLMMHIARQTLGIRTANLAGAFWAMSPLAIVMPTFFWETSLSTMLLTGMVAFAVHAQRRPSSRTWITMGVYCAASGLVNPALLPSLIALLAYVAWSARNRAPRLGLALALLVMCAVYSPWPIRNAITLHAFIPLRSNMGFELWEGNRAGGDGSFDDSLHPYYDKQALAEYQRLGEVAYMQQKSATAKAYIRAHPAEFVTMTMRRCTRFWSGLGQASSEVSWAIVGHVALTTTMGIAGLVFLFKRDRASAFLYSLPIAIFPLPYYITHPDFRFRLVVDPLLTILSAYLLTRMWPTKHPKEHVTVPVTDHETAGDTPLFSDPAKVKYLVPAQGKPANISAHLGAKWRHFGRF